MPAKTAPKQQAISPTILAALVVASVLAVVGWFFFVRETPVPVELPPQFRDRFESGVLADERFRSLVFPRGVPVGEGALGRPNPFLPLDGSPPASVAPIVSTSTTADAATSTAETVPEEPAGAPRLNLPDFSL